MSNPEQKEHLAKVLQFPDRKPEGEDPEPTPPSPAPGARAESGEGADDMFAGASQLERPQYGDEEDLAMTG